MRKMPVCMIEAELLEDDPLVEEGAVAATLYL